MKKALEEAAEQERTERTATYSLLDSNLANFQQDFAMERHERCRLDGELLSLRGEVSSQILNLKEEIASMTQELYAIRDSDHDAQPGAQALALVNDLFSGDAASVRLKDIVREEIVRVFGDTYRNKELKDLVCETVQDGVARVFGEHQERQQELANLISMLASQEKCDRIAHMATIVERIADLERRAQAQSEDLKIQSEALEKKSEMQALVNMGDREQPQPELADTISREEFESQYRRLLEAVNSDAAVTKDEFEGQVARLWEAIMHLQALQLDGMQQQTREVAFTKGLAMLGDTISLPNGREAPSRSGTPAHCITPKSTSSTSSPAKGVSGRSLLGQPMQTGRLGSPTITDAAPFLHDALIPSSSVGR
jgi:hypothetical protein